MKRRPRRDAALFTSAKTGDGSDLWMTPTWIVLEIERVLGLRFVVDAACNVESDVIARLGRNVGLSMTWPKLDGLQESWSARVDLVPGAVWVNPPYSVSSRWIRKAVYERRQGVESVFLIPARTDTKAFHEHIVRHADVYFIAGRLEFEPPEGVQTQGESATFPSMVCHFHPAATGALRIFAGNLHTCPPTA